MSIKPHTIAAPSGNDVIIYATPGVLDSFFTMPLPDTAASPAIVAESVKTHSRRRYPGDSNPSTVSSHSRDQLSAERSKYPVLPGQNAYAELPVDVNGKTKYDATRFTFVGNFTDLYQYVLGNNAVAFQLRSPGGVAYDVPAPV